MEATPRATKRNDITPVPPEDTSPLSQVTTRTVLRHLANLSTHPLVSASAAAYVLGVLYLPRCIFSLLLSPALVSALLLLATLLHFGSSSQHDHPDYTRSPELRQPSHSEDQQRRPQEQHHPRPFPQPDAEPSPCAAALGSTHKPLLLAEHHHLVASPRRGPLEVIYEEYEGEDEEDDSVAHSPGRSGSPEQGSNLGMLELERLSLRCYSDDSNDDSSSDFMGGLTSPAWDLPEELFFRWDAEEDGLIEIVLEEDNLIEIDISACR